MKASRYNIYINLGQSVLVFNTLYERFFEVNAIKAPYIKQLINCPDCNYELYHAFIDKMKADGFIIDSEDEEEVALKQKYLRQRRPEIYRLMILPTYECNLRCWYCEQKRQNLWLDKTTYQKALDLWTEHAKRTDISTMHLSWFGGEPLMAFEKIEKLTSKAKTIAENFDKQFICDVTTNATLLTEKRIQRLKNAGVTSYQITIDGIKNVHDTIKKLGSKSAFDTSLNNINFICNHSKCILRFNYTNETLRPEEVINEILERISPDNLKNIIFSPMKVWQESISNIDPYRVDRLFDLAFEAGLNPQPLRGEMCYADWANFDCIFPNGKVCKCDNSHPDSARGDIIDGKVVWHGDCTSHIPVFETGNTLCKSCEYFPICWGPCEPRREEMMKQKKFICVYDNKDEQMQERIIRLYKSQKYR